MKITPLLANSPSSPNVYVGGSSIHFFVGFPNFFLPPPWELWRLYSPPSILFFFFLPLALLCNQELGRKRKYIFSRELNTFTTSKQSLDEEQLSSTTRGIRQPCASSGKLLPGEFTTTSSSVMWSAGLERNSNSSVEHGLQLELIYHSLLLYAPCHQTGGILSMCIEDPSNPWLFCPVDCNTALRNSALSGNLSIHFTGC